MTIRGIGDFVAQFKGESAGHPFRWNQWSGGGPGGDDSSDEESSINDTMMSLSKRTGMSELQAKAQNQMSAAYDKGNQYHGKYDNLNQAMNSDPSIYDKVENMSHNEMVAFDAGIRGSGKPEFVTAWRVGDIPKEGRSTNFVEQKLEPGLSVMSASNGMKTQDEFSKMFIMAKNVLLFLCPWGLN